MVKPRQIVPSHESEKINAQIKRNAISCSYERIVYFKHHVCFYKCHTVKNRQKVTVYTVVVIKNEKENTVALLNC